MTLYTQLADSTAKALQDPAYMAKLVADPKGTLTADGVDTGSSVISAEWVESTNTLCILVEKGGADWTGAVILNIKK